MRSHDRFPCASGGSSLTGPIGPHRRWARTSVSLDDVKTIRQAFGGTVNDVVLAAVTRGFRELLRGRGEPVDGRTITTLIPVSMRSADARGTLDNRVSAVYARLPIGIDDPVETLVAIHEHMEELKVSHEIDASAAIVGVGDVAPPVLAAVLARVLVHSQEIVQTVATNVPGPQVPLYVCGRRMLEAYPYVPIAGHIRIGVAIWSYCGDMYFGITGDWDSAPDIDRLAAGDRPRVPGPPEGSRERGRLRAMTAAFRTSSFTYHGNRLVYDDYGDGRTAGRLPARLADRLGDQSRHRASPRRPWQSSRAARSARARSQ